MQSSLSKELNNKYKPEIIINNYKKILVCLMPIIPHFSSEAISDIKIKDKIEWPNYEESLLVEETIPYVIQINGKKRALLKVSRDITEDELIVLVSKDTNIKKYLENKQIKRKIFVPGKLINIIV